MNKDEFFMKKALELAERGRGATNPNPMVGAVVVKAGRIISVGYHKRIGELHAEALALAKAGKKAKGADIYVNMEPCTHVGRTPPCTDAIIKSRIKKVFCAMPDPNPLNYTKGIRILRKNNIEVSVGILQKDAQRLNEVFIKYITKKIPFVTLKVAESIDGKIATRKRDSKWISSEASRRYVHRLRREVDAVLVGVNTIYEDDPLLTSRMGRSPIKVILDPYLRISEDARVFSKKSPCPSIIAIFRGSLDKEGIVKKIKRLNRKGVLVIGIGSRNKRLDLEDLLKKLAKLEISHLLIEGGGDTFAGFIENRLVDRVFFFIAPKIIGGRDAVTSIEGRGVDRVKEAVRLEGVEIKLIGKDILVKGEPR